MFWPSESCASTQLSKSLTLRVSARLCVFLGVSASLSQCCFVWGDVSYCELVSREVLTAHVSQRIVVDTDRSIISIHLLIDQPINTNQHVSLNLMALEPRDV